MPSFRRFLTGIAVAAGVLTAPAAHAGFVVYQNDFQANTDGFSTAGTAVLPTDGSPIASPTASSRFLGRRSNGTSTLTLPGLAAGTYTVAFDLFIGGSWDGNSFLTGGPDRWRLTADGTPLVDATFNNGNEVFAFLGVPPTQTYSDAAPAAGVGGSLVSAFAGADVRRGVAQAPGPENLFNRYAIYYFGRGAGNPTLTFTSAGGTVGLAFRGGPDLQGTSDEFWAIDNVVVTHVTPAVAPVPPTAGVLAVAAGLLARPRRRTA